MNDEISRLVNMAVSQINAGMVILDADCNIVFWNRFMEIHGGIPEDDVKGKNLFEVFPDLKGSGIKKKIDSVYLLKNFAFTSWEYRPYLFKFPNTHSVVGGEEWMQQDCTFSPMIDESGNVTHICLSVFDSTNTASYQKKLLRTSGSLIKQRNKLSEMNKRLEEAQNQLLQSEKMAAVGQLAAGVAHEINNPVGYVNSNVSALEGYIDELLQLLAAYEACEPMLDSGNALAESLQQTKKKIDLTYLKEDLVDLLRESKEGLDRVKKIVQDLKDFSHVDESEWQYADLHKGLDSTLNVVNNEVKYKADVVKNYGDIGEVKCLSSQINQVFMNLLVNAAHAIKEHGTITISTGTEGEGVWVEIEDTGAGIEKEKLGRIFEPFFTTKPVGKGTGLGLSLSYNIINKHKGKISVESELGKGTKFRIWLPKVNASDEAAEASVA